jgi:aminopeptidase
MDSDPITDSARTNLLDTIRLALRHAPGQPALIVYDVQSGLSRLLAAGYRTVLPEAYALDFDAGSPDEVQEAIEGMPPGGLVVLVQSTSFRLSRFRVRIELFKRGLKVVEHPHLARMRREEYETYLDSLAYDPAYYRTVGPRLRDRILSASRIRVVCEGTELVYDSPFENPRLNIGDYEEMKNIGGQFPIGEIFTEPRDIRRVNGAVKLFAFGDTDFTVNAPDRPFTAVIEKGILISSPDAPEAFRAVLDQIRAVEDRVWVRELGFGLNRSFTREKRVSDIGTYERMCGIHLSLGAKHLQYKKPDFPPKPGFHVDVFADAEQVQIDGETVYRNGRYEPALSGAASPAS